LRSPTVTPKLQRIAAQAARDSERVFTTLAHLIDEDFLREAYRHTSKSSAPGIDGVTAEAYAEHLDEHLRDLYERLRSGRYQAAPVERVWIEKEDGSQRPIGKPAFEDKIVQRAVAMLLEAIYEQDFLDCSYGFRPDRSPHAALHELRERCINEGIGWIVDADVSGYFDSIDRTRLREVLRKRVNDGSILRLIGKWLRAGVMEDGVLTHPETGVVQGGVISPVLANLFLHYAFDAWMQREQPSIPFERYADDIIAHCQSEAQARWLQGRITTRLAQCQLELHLDKTHIVYCKDADRRGPFSHTSCDFLGYTFRPRRSKNRWGKYFVNFSPAVSARATKTMRQTIRSWRLHLRSDKTLDDLSRMFNPILRGWVQYYGQYYKSALYPTFQVLDRILVKWAMRKFKKLKGHQRRATHWLGRIARRQPRLFVHWQMGVRPAAGR